MIDWTQSCPNCGARLPVKTWITCPNCGADVHAKIKPNGRIGKVICHLGGCKDKQEEE